MTEQTEYYQGRVLDVSEVYIGTEVTSTHAIGATVLNVYDAQDFSDEGGNLSIEGTTYQYLTKDDDANTIKLNAALSVSIAADTEVFIYPPAMEKEAMVQIDEEEAVMATVPHNLVGVMDALVRDEFSGESVIVAKRDDDYEIHDLLAETYVLYGEYIDPGSIPGGTDPEAVHGYVTEYAIGPDETTVPTSGWSTATPTRTPGQYIWFRTIVTYGDGSSATTNPALLTGNDGAAGTPGKGVSSTAVTYQVSSSGTTAPTGTWQSSVQATSPGQFLWTRTVITYTDATTATLYAVSAHGSTGSTGTPGRGISSTAVTYQVHTNGTTAPTGTWQAAPQATSPGQFLWTRTITTYTDSTTTTSYSVSAHGSTGSTGSPGVGVSSTAVTYQVGSSGTTAPTGTWQSTVQATSPGQFLWTRTITTYTDTSTATSYSVAAHGASGASGTPGVGVSSTAVTYQVHTSGTTAPTGTWQSTVQATSPGQFLWTRTITTYTDASTTTSYAVSAHGATGSTGSPGTAGVSVTAITPYFARLAQSASAPIQPTNQATPPAPWQATEPAWVINTYLYRTERITYSNGTYGYTNVVLVSADAAVGPTGPPTASPAVRVTGTTSSLIAETDEVPAGTMIEYHISTTDGFAATLGGATKFTETEATVALIDKMPDGTPLDPAQQYYVRTFAYNVKGSAPAASAQAPGRINLSNVDALVTAKLVASFISAGKISVGQFTLDSVGMRVNRPGGGYVFNFPFSGVDTLDLTAAVTAVSLTVMNNLTINGSGILNGIVTAANGIVAPTQAPGVSRMWPSITTTLGDGTSDMTEFHHGLIQHPSQTSQIITALNYVGTCTLRSFHKTSGAWTGDITLSGAWKNTFAPIGGLTYLGGNYYILGTDSSRAGKWYIYRVVASTGVKDAEVEVAADWAFFDGAYPRLFTDGTGVMYAFVNSSKNLRIVGFTAALAAGNSANIMTGLASRYNVGDVHMGAHDSVANRVWIAFRGSQDVLCFNPVTPGTPSTWTRDSTYDFPRPSSVAGFTYDTLNGQMLTLDTTALLYYHGKYPTNKSIQAKYAWYDANSTNSFHETQPGPSKTYTLPARSYLTLQTEPPPDVDNLDPLNTDKANQVAMYATDDGGTVWRRLVYTASPWGANYATLAGLASGTPKVTNEFLSSTVATPGRMKSLATDTLTGTSAAVWEFDGSGKGKMGAYTTGRHYAARTRASDQATATGATTILDFGSTLEPHVGISWDGTNTRFVVSKSGLYMVHCSVNWQNNTSGRRTLRLDKNSTAFAAKDDMGVNNLTQSLTVIMDLAAGDTVRAAVFQNSGSALNLLGADDTRSKFAIGFLSP